MPDQPTRIVAVGLLTESDLQQFGTHFDRWYPVNDTPCFGELLAAIDDADRVFSRERDRMRLRSHGSESTTG